MTDPRINMRKELKVPGIIENNRLSLLRVTLWISALTVYLEAVNNADNLPEWVVAEMMMFGGALVVASIPDWGEDTHNCTSSTPGVEELDT